MNCRILLVNHDLCLQTDQSFDDFDKVTEKLQNACALYDLGSSVESSPPKPIIWLAHCSGGLLVQNVLMQDERLRCATAGVVFLGTPHLGTPVAEVLMTSHTFAKSHESSKALGALKTNAHPFLLDAFLSFNIPFLNLFETKQLQSPLSGLPRSEGMRFVPEYSGSPEKLQKHSGMNTDECFINEGALNCDHISICKFSSPLDPNIENIEFPIFQRILKSTRAFLGNYPRTATSPQPSIALDQIDAILGSYQLRLCRPDTQIKTLFSVVAYLLGAETETVTRKTIDWQKKNEQLCITATPVRQLMNGRTSGQYCSDMESEHGLGDYINLIAVSKVFQREIHIMALPLDDLLSTIIHPSPGNHLAKMYLLQLSPDKFEPLEFISQPTSSSSS